MTGRVSKIKGSARAAGHYPAPALEPQGVLELTDSEDDIIELTDSDDVLELTDSEDPVDLRASITLKKLERNKNRAIKPDKVANILKDLTEETSKLRQAVRDVVEANKVMNKKLMDLAQDHLSCGICNERMWSPYLLHICGHTFCQTCLQRWFSELKRKSYPYIPEYTCPFCRQITFEAPIKVHAMKDMCHFLATSNGEVVPRPGNSVPNDPWFPFFPVNE